MILIFVFGFQHIQVENNLTLKNVEKHQTAILSTRPYLQGSQYRQIRQEIPNWSFYPFKAFSLFCFNTFS